MPTPTHITVRVIAVDGKFLADDIGGASITIRDAETQEILHQGVTKGDSGPKNLMCVSTTRGTPIATDKTTAALNTTLSLSAPRRIQVTAYGPLGARASANTVSLTTWIYPGKHLTAGNGLLLQIPGLICQINYPPVHSAQYVEPADINIDANVAMMCGCPISDKPAGAICEGVKQPWMASDFDVVAVIESSTGHVTRLPLKWDVQGKVAGRFQEWWLKVPQGTYLITVVAQQISTANTGVAFSTVVVQPGSSS